MTDYQKGLLVAFFGPDLRPCVVERLAAYAADSEAFLCGYHDGRAEMLEYFDEVSARANRERTLPPKGWH